MAEQIILDNATCDNLLSNERMNDFTAAAASPDIAILAGYRRPRRRALYRVPTRHDPQHPRHGRQP